MASVSGSDPTPDARSGGKILTEKRRRVAATPYDRPPRPQRRQQPQGSPNWLTGVIFPATRMIASGAVKMISSVFDSSSSSSSSSSSDSEGDAEDDVTNDDRYDYTDGVNGPNKDCMISSEARNFVNEPQVSLHSSVTKSAIARLLMQERFSRQERDRLVQIIDSRVMDPIVGGEADVVLTDTPVGNIRYDTTDPCAEAVLEARKWLEDKKVGSSPSSDLANESRILNTVALQHFENEAGSPVDVAKSYMKSCPPWASPLVEHNELQTPFALTRELFREGTSTSFGGGLLSSKKRNSLASGSWNIEEELRRVRSKASEDMLNSLPSTNIDLSSFRTTPKSGGESLADSPVCGGVEGKSKLMTESYPVDASGATAPGQTSSIGISALEMRRDVLENEILKSHPALLSSEVVQNLGAVKKIGECADFMSNHSVHLDIEIEPCDDPRLSQRKIPQAKDAKESEVTRNVNGLLTPKSRSFSGEVGTGDIRSQPDEGNSAVAHINTMTSKSIQVEDMWELLSEASVEVPIVDETNGIFDVSQSVSSVLHEDLPSGLTQPSTDTFPGTDDGVALKRGGKKTSKVNRRGRGKGK